MSVLDQAFFKAYGLAEEPDEPHGAEAPAAAESSRPAQAACMAETATVAKTATESLIEPSRPREGRQSFALSGSILAGAPWPTKGPDAWAVQAEVAVSSGNAISSGEVSVLSEEITVPLEGAAPTGADAGSDAQDASPAAAGTPSETGTSAPASPGPAVAGPRGAMSAEHRESASVGFCPQLQVDRYFWPAAVIRLYQAAEGPLDAVIDTVALGAAQGRNVVGVGHCHSGDGATTLLLCLARRLADHGVKVAILDADRRSPRLARRLGVLAEAGWDDVCAGHVSLAEVVIESLHDRLALVPRQEAATGLSAGEGGPASPSDGRARAAQAVSPYAVVAELRRHYDVVLVDLGLCVGDAATLGLPGEPPCVDRVILVRNQRRPRPAEFAAAVRQLRSLGLEVAVVDNFV